VRWCQGRTVIITGDKGFTWNEIYKWIASGLGVEAKIVHVPTDTLVRYNSEWEGPLVGDKTWTALFDNSKVKRVAGEFTCAEDIDVILAEPIRYLKSASPARFPSRTNSIRSTTGSAPSSPRSAREHGHEDTEHRGSPRAGGTP
jgi:hypothetical protein